MSHHEAVVQFLLIAIPTLLLSLINTFGRDLQRVPRLATIGAAAREPV